MKISFGKRLGAIALAMVLLFGLAPIDARATTICSDGQHIPGNTLYPADWNDQTGGYAYDYYKCTVCGWGCDENGNSHVFVGPDNGCSGGYKCHKPGTTVYEPDYTPCGGGFEVRYYLCIACNRPVDAVGTLVFRTAGTGNHTPGSEKHDADYNPCNGGFQDDFYECTACGCPVDENGQEMQYTPGIGHHTPGSEKHDADYTSCQGGFKSEWYECTVCGNPVDSNGDPMEWFEGNGEHTIVQVPGKAPTYEEDGYISFWQCEDCGLAFKDAEGTVIIEDEAEILLPKLEWEETAEEQTNEKTETVSRVEVSSGLREVPEEVADQYSSVAEIKEVLIQAALNVEGTFSSETTKSVLLDVELKIQKPNGTWVAVTPENFPAKGVEVLLPYPDGTNKDSYTFVVTHMITTGSKAGQIEVLPCTLEQDGIRVRFTSMSPVVIAYQEKDARNTVETPENNPAEATSPQTGDDSNIALWLSILLLSGIGLGYMLFQKEEEQ